LNYFEFYQNEKIDVYFQKIEGHEMFFLKIKMLACQEKSQNWKILAPRVLINDQFK